MARRHQILHVLRQEDRAAPRRAGADGLRRARARNAARVVLRVSRAESAGVGRSAAPARGEKMKEILPNLQRHRYHVTVEVIAEGAPNPRTDERLKRLQAAVREIFGGLDIIGGAFRLEEGSGACPSPWANVGSSQRPPACRLREGEVRVVVGARSNAGLRTAPRSRSGTVGQRPLSSVYPKHVRQSVTSPPTVSEAHSSSSTRSEEQTFT